MKKLVLLIALSWIPLVLSANIERISIYYQGDESEMSEDSRVSFERFSAQYGEEFYLQLIEINAYVEEGVQFNSVEVLNQRISILLNFLDTDESELSVNVYGKKRIELNFSPDNWNRIDLYYNLEKKQVLTASTTEKILVKESILYEEQSVSTVLVAYTAERKTSNKIEYRKATDLGYNIHEKVVRLKIEFYGNKSKIMPACRGHLFMLYDTLQKNPHLTAHIRGHVCCGNKVSLSRRRARTVYRYLIKNGIERDRLSYAGYGNQKPLVFPERTAVDRGANRRVDVVFDEIQELKKEVGEDIMAGN